MEEHFKFRRVNEITGTLVLVVIAALIGTVVLTGQSQRWFKSRVALRIVLPDDGAAGIRQGSEVYFLGTLVGSVSDVIVDASGRMEAQANIRHDFFRFVRADSSASVKKRFGVAGDSFFEITRGKGQPLPEKNASIVCNEQLPSALDSAIEEIRHETLRVLRKTSAGLDTWTQLGAGLTESREHLDQLIVRMDHMAAGVEAGKGTVGKLITDTVLADEAAQLLARANRAMAEFQVVATNISAVVKHVQTGTARLPEITDTVAEETKLLLARANQTMSGLQGVLTNLSAAVKNVQAGTARLPEITDAVADEAKSLPGLVQQTQTSMRELERLIEAMQRHWLVRKLVNPTNPPPLRPLPEAEASNKQSVKSLHLPRESSR